MNCTTRMYLLEPPLTTAFGMMFIVISVMASTGNGFALFIIWRPGHKLTSSTKILTSLAVSDLLVGIILSPLTCFQVLNKVSLSNCKIDYIRRYLFFFLCNTSGLTLAVISYDRYILLTKLTNYNKFMTKRKLIILLVIAWMVLAILPIFQIKIFGQYIYLLIFITCFTGVLIFVIASYFCIFQVVRQTEKQLQTFNLKFAEGESSSDITEHKEIETIDKTRKTKDLKESNIPGCGQRREKKYVALAKSVLILILCFLLFYCSIVIWTILSLLNLKYDFVDKKTIQICYIIAAVTVQFNSCINPFIYFMKNPEFRKRAKSTSRYVTSFWSNVAPANR